MVGQAAVAEYADALEAALSSFVGRQGDPLPALVALVEALRPARPRDADSAASRFRRMMDLLRGRAELRAALGSAVGRLFATRDQISFYADAGILPNTSFGSELGHRFGARVLPHVPDPSRLDDCVAVIFHDRRDQLWLDSVPRELREEFWHLISIEATGTEEAFARGLGQIVAAAQILATRVAAMGLEPELGRVLPQFRGVDSPFVELQAEILRAIDQFRRRVSGADREDAELSPPRVLALIVRCHEAIATARANAATQGTSLALTYLLVRLEQSIDRLHLLVDVLATQRAARARSEMVESWSDFMANAIRGLNERKTVRGLMGRVTGLLALRVTENASRTGEHYITTDRAEYFAMWRSALGGGFVICFMALIKILLSKLNLAPAVEAIAYSLNYGLGFVLIHLLGFTVATKQPAMTAAAIAAAVHQMRGRLTDAERMATLITDVVRSQTAAILGNVLMALPLAIAVGVAMSLYLAASPVTPEKAFHLLGDSAPVAGGGIAYAAIAGVCLFLSGLISGYFDNRAAYNRIGERVGALSWLHRVIGARRAESLGNWVDRDLGALAGNFFFGVMLGSMPFVGFIFGLPLDIRHVAFSSANFGYALAALEFDIPLVTAGWALLGVALIGLTNLTVSFGLALWVALRSRQLRFSEIWPVVRMLPPRFAGNPRGFLFPPRGAAGA